MGIFLENSKKFKVFLDNTLYKLPTVSQADCTHAYSSIIIVPTCTSQGYTQYTCVVCGHTYTGNTTPMRDHTIITIPGYAATPTTPGLTDGKKCGACGLIIQEQVEIPVAHSHTADYKTENRIAATCTTNGSYDSVKYCTICLEEISRTPTTVPATGHTEGSPVIENRTESTCTRNGGYDTIVRCTSCNTVLSSAHTELPLVDHEWGDWIIDKNATESTTGSKHHDCDNCDASETETIPVLGHTHTAGTAKRENEVAASCETDGSYNLVVRCTSCNNILSSTPQTIPALGHDYDPCECSRCGDTDHDWDPCECSKCDEVLHGQELPYATVHPTCTEDGQTGGTYCSDCGIQFSAPEVLPATGHTEVVVEAVMPTCTDPGMTLGKYCSVCDAVLIQSYTVPATGHDSYIILRGYDATCTEPGLTEGRECSGCGMTRVAQETIPPLGHSYVGNGDASDPTCEEAGNKESETCSRCGDTISGDTIPATGHNMQSNNDYQAPTCSEPGQYTSYYCANGCGHTSGGAEIPPTGNHVNGAAVQENYVPATCIANGGYDTVMYCLKCGEETSRVPTVINATGNHSYDNWDDCDCEVCGEHRHVLNDYCTCIGCGESFHSLVDVCYCENCDEEFHDWDGNECNNCGKTR